MSKDILVRAGKTFVQAFVATLALSAANVVDVQTAKAAVIAAVAAGLSALGNFVIATK